MDELLVSEDELLQKHKRERKELQAQIQVLKKSICKGDKKKKKEVADEIARKEEDLEKKQDEELARWKIFQVTLNDTDAENLKETSDKNNDVKSKESEKVQQRVSKAQRRRCKKENAERERNQRIIEQEAFNIYGKRNVEIQSIKKILYERDLMLYEIPSDGHCLYNAVAHQLKMIGEIPLSLNDLRMKTAIYLRQNRDDFLPFISNPDSDQLLSPEQYEKYCNDIAETCAWGGAIELQVLSRILERQIEVIQATGTPYIVGDEFSKRKRIILTYHRYMYELGAHYNSVTKFLKADES
ncbi:PREDICTED: OTU domain-containing protein 6B [Polistes dominula]|uniref:OTU domain-containing protein 6B n=1 Tax=Polistes dominula TaxID=743375 RepID=A0ABM1J338_POLDO|nr:PREDICTED: OTU domain-containing protein 6B [Polistes dominula]